MKRVHLIFSSCPPEQFFPPAAACAGGRCAFRLPVVTCTEGYQVLTHSDRATAVCSLTQWELLLLLRHQQLHRQSRSLLRPLVNLRTALAVRASTQAGQMSFKVVPAGLLFP